MRIRTTRKGAARVTVAVVLLLLLGLGATAWWLSDDGIKAPPSALREPGRGPSGVSSGPPTPPVPSTPAPATVPVGSGSGGDGSSGGGTGGDGTGGGHGGPRPGTAVGGVKIPRGSHTCRPGQVSGRQVVSVPSPRPRPAPALPGTVAVVVPAAVVAVGGDGLPCVLVAGTRYTTDIAVLVANGGPRGTARLSVSAGHQRGCHNVRVEPGIVTRLRCPVTPAMDRPGRPYVLTVRLTVGGTRYVARWYHDVVRPGSATA